MSAHFSRFGPFAFDDFRKPLRSVDFTNLWNRTGAELAGAIGVYLIVSGSGKDSIPIYIGQSQVSFRQRLKFVHHAFLLAYEHYPKRELSIVFFARVTTKTGKFVSKSDKHSLKSIDSLELLLLRDCMTLNQQLLNKKELTFFRGLKIADYIDPTSSAVTPDAKKLKRLIGQKRK
jgi:hypothetical protein